MIVDDIVENLQTISRFFETSHPEYRLYQATGGKSALELTEKTSFDLILTDWDMPDLSGIEFLRAIKSNARTKKIPVIMVTGVMLSSKDLDLALSAGAHDYIRKPIDPVELSVRTHTALSLAFCQWQEIEKKNIELVEKTLILIKNNEFNIQMSDKLKHLLEIYENNLEAKALIHEIIDEVDQKVKQDSWQQFELAFQNVHTEFGKNLILQFPKLTPGEFKLCILIKLGMTIKDMASLLYQSPDSLKVTRSRLRKKLQINNDINFNNFLAAF
ncbi:MAG: response regulator [Methanoregula sp.]|nr:response regulator [Methanoregula sp.]